MAPPQDAASIASRAVDLALQVGADMADAYVLATSRLVLNVRNGEIESLVRATTQGLGLRVKVDRRTALAHTTDMSSFSLVRLGSTALEMARVLPAPREPVIFGPAATIEAMPHPDVDLRDETIETKRRRLSEIEKAMLGVPGVSRTASVGWTEVDGEIGIANSRGMLLYAPVCRIGVGVEAIAERDGDSYSGSYSAEVPTRRALPAPEEMGRLAGTRAVRMLGARAIPSCAAPVIFTPETGYAVLASLIGPLRGDNVGQKRSYLADRMGQMIASPGVTIRDNPLLARGVGRRTFDDEGSAVRDLALIEGGRLNAFLCDLESGAKLGVPGGGNAVRESYTSSVGIGTTNFYLEPGTLTPEQIVRDTERGLLVTNLSGWWVGLSPATDTFSSAAMGLWIEKGEPVYPVRGISIGGALRQMLASIDRIGDDLDFRGETSNPTFRVAEMAISGT
jgi:PmbA protein